MRASAHTGGRTAGAWAGAWAGRPRPDCRVEMMRLRVAAARRGGNAASPSRGIAAAAWVGGAPGAELRLRGVVARPGALPRDSWRCKRLINGGPARELPSCESPPALRLRGQCGPQSAAGFPTGGAASPRRHSGPGPARLGLGLPCLDPIRPGFTAPPQSLMERDDRAQYLADYRLGSAAGPAGTALRLRTAAESESQAGHRLLVWSQPIVHPSHCHPTPSASPSESV